MNKHIVLISKDATLPEYFEPYGGKIRKTPNIKELAKKGTIFMNHYTAAPSTAMAFAAMATGKYPYEMNYSHYYEVKEYNDSTIFDDLYNQGFECHIIWSSNYIDKAEKYTKCFGKNTIHHDKLKFNEPCGFNASYSKENRTRNYEIARNKYKEIIDIINSIDNTKKIFLWIHMPHCLKGYISYGDDIEIFDNLVGYIRKKFGDNSIYITADHGHMNGQKCKVGYGFDVYNNATRIPLITPRINNISTIEFVTSNVQLRDIITKNKIEKREYVFSDSAYYAQPNRKLAIIKNNMYYIFNKKSKKEEMYDLNIDPHQDINLINSYIWKDKDRLCSTDIRQVILSDNWDDYQDYIKDFRIIRQSIWKKGKLHEELKQRIHANKLRIIYFIKGIARRFK